VYEYLFLFEYVVMLRNRTGDGKGPRPLHAVDGWETGKFSRSREAGDVRFPLSRTNQKTAGKAVFLCSIQ